MKNIRKAYQLLLITLVMGCSDTGELQFIETVALPSNIAAVYDIPQDNSGRVRITPTGEGAHIFEAGLGDGSDPVRVNSGESIEHVYAEGTYTLSITAYNILGDATQINQELVVSFQAPQNLEVSIENDPLSSRKVNITVTADFAILYEFYSGETGVDQPVLTANIGESISYDYQTAGLYSIKVIAKGAAIETTEHTEEFEVTEIVTPLTKAPVPPYRNDFDVVSVYSDQYPQTPVDAYTTNWSVVGMQEEVAIEGDQTLVYRDLAYAGIITESVPINAAAMEKVHFDVWSSNVSTFKIKLVDFNGTGYNNNIDNLEFEIENAIDQEGQWIGFDLPLSDFTGVPLTDINQIVISAAPVGTVFIDNLYFYRESTTSSFNDGLLTNGDFEAGSDSWTVGVNDNAPAPVTTSDGNTYYSVNVAVAGNVWDVNLSQKVAIVGGNTYTLTFDAWSDTDRSMVAGIGLSAAPWTNTTTTLDIGVSRTTYSFTYSQVGFEASDARVLFDIGGEVGLVNIDNVSLVLGAGNILENGNFENGSTPWIVGVDDNAPAPITTTNGNTHYSVNVSAAGNAYDVNLSQKVEITQGKTYFLSFDAWSDTNRTIVAGIGLSAAPWTNTGAPLEITPTRTTFTYTYTDVSFGAPDARVLFDLGAETGLVNIDDVTLSTN